MSFEVSLCSGRFHFASQYVSPEAPPCRNDEHDESVAMATDVHANPLVFLWAGFHLGIRLADICPLFLWLFFLVFFFLKRFGTFVCAELYAFVPHPDLRVTPRSTELFKLSRTTRYLEI